jgi:adenosylcobinamide-GDP ribazoletransferase
MTTGHTDNKTNTAPDNSSGAEGSVPGGQASTSEQASPTNQASPCGPMSGSFVGDIARCVRFYSRLPVPQLPGEHDPHARPDFTRIPRALPVAAIIVAAPGALVLWLALLIGLSPMVAACLSVTTATIASGAFHEDGLADMADGFWGGSTPERRLEIMKDSRVGAFGAAALGLSLILRVIALGDLIPLMTKGESIAAVLAAGCISRTTGLIPLTFLPPARPDGFSASVGRPSRQIFMFAVLLTFGLVLAIGIIGKLPLLGLLAGGGLAVGIGMGLSKLSFNLIEGQTGDVAGATQQLGEIAVLMGLLVAARALL